MRQLASLGYVSEPHAAIGYRSLARSLTEDEVGIFLGTAHPAKFRETVENVLGQPISLPQALADCVGKPDFSVELENSYEVLKKHLFATLA
jgi:threonine synthase